MVLSLWGGAPCLDDHVDHCISINSTSFAARIFSHVLPPFSADPSAMGLVLTHPPCLTTTDNVDSTHPLATAQHSLANPRHRNPLTICNACLSFEPTFDFLPALVVEIQPTVNPLPTRFRTIACHDPSSRRQDYYSKSSHYYGHPPFKCTHSLVPSRSRSRDTDPQATLPTHSTTVFSMFSHTDHPHFCHSQTLP